MHMLMHNIHSLEREDSLSNPVDIINFMILVITIVVKNLL